MSAPPSILETILNNISGRVYENNVNYRINDVSVEGILRRSAIAEFNHQAFLDNGVGFKAFILAYENQGLNVATTGRENSPTPQAAAPAGGVLGEAAAPDLGESFPDEDEDLQAVQELGAALGALTQINFLNDVRAKVWIPVLDQDLPTPKIKATDAGIIIQDRGLYQTGQIIDERLLQMLPPPGSLVLVDYENRKTREGLTIKLPICTDPNFGRIILAEFAGIVDVESMAEFYEDLSATQGTFGFPSGDALTASFRDLAPDPSKVSATPSTAEDINNAYPQIAAVPGWAEKIVEVAGSLQIPDPGWLANVMYYETARTLDPSIVNAENCVGLIQFCTTTGAAQVGKTPAELIAMDAITQMNYVEMYLSPYAGRMNTSSDLYMAIFFPAGVGQGPYYSIYNYNVEHHSVAYAQRVTRANNGIQLAGQYQSAADRAAKLPTHLQQATTPT